MEKKQFNDTFLKACRKEPTPYVPVWYMRQAGRYQPEYRAIRKKYTFFEMNDNPEVCAEVTRLPVEQLGVDAAILFADIMTPLKPIGVDVSINSGIGPVIANPIRSMGDVERLQELDPEKHVPMIREAIRILRQQLSVPLIGFAGAPFTLASYMVEAQVEAGAQAVQVFDSWVGALSREDYQTYIAPVMETIFTELKPLGVPTIYFGIGAGHLLPEWNKLPVDVLGLDWRTTIREAREMGINKALQGNLDPSLLVAPWEMLEKKAKEIIDQGKEQPGYIFNLGHGVFPEVKVETLQKLTTLVHTYSQQSK